MSELKTIPMFPLGSVLFPTLVLPLHVFEPRYRTMVEHCLEGDQEFGVVLIERGSEVGGGDVRSDVGTVARIVESARMDDGRWAVVAVGERRVRVVQWLDDDPYPRAIVSDWPDLGDSAPGSLVPSYDRAQTLFRRVAGLKAELNEPSPPVAIELSEDPDIGSFQLAALGPFGPSDQQLLLAIDGPAERLEVLIRMLGEESEFLSQRLSMG